MAAVQSADLVLAFFFSVGKSLRHGFALQDLMHVSLVSCERVATSISCHVSFEFLALFPYPFIHEQNALSR